MNLNGQNNPPEKKRIKKEPRSLFFEINSNDRDRRIHKSSNEFRWNFPKLIKDVTQLRIIGGSIPQPLYNIDYPYNGMTVRIGIDTYDIVVPPGNYDTPSLCTKISNLINIHTAPTNIFSISIDGATGRFKLERVTGFASSTLIFGKGGSFIDLVDNDTGALLEPRSLATILGFQPTYTISDGGTGTIIAPFPLHLIERLNRIYLYINSESTHDITTISRANGYKKPSFIIYMDQDSKSHTKFLNKENYDMYILSTNTPISIMNWLDISFRDEYYRPINFNGREVTLLCEAVVYES